MTEKCVPSPACAEDGTVFNEDNNSKATAWAWDFGDGGNDNVRNPLHAYKAAQSYPVKLVRTFADGTKTTEVQNIIIGELPPAFQKWKADTTICPGQTIDLNPYPTNAPAGAKYIWY
ncbi:MAG: PKD domain-containing protein, partial [Dyadobacter sp.]